MSIRHDRGMPSGPGGRKPRPAPLLVAIPLVALLIFNAITGRIDLTSAFEGGGLDAIVQQQVALQATAAAEQTATALQEAAPTATTEPLVATEPTPATPGCEPSGDDHYCLYTVEPGDSLASIASRFGLDGGEVTGWELIFASNLLDLSSLEDVLDVGMTLRIPRSNGILHTVLPGDSVSSMAAAYDVTTADIAAANALADPNSVQIGDILLVPSPAQLPPVELDFAPEGELEPVPDEEPTDGEEDTTEPDSEATDEEPDEEPGADTTEPESEAEEETAPETPAEPEERRNDPQDSASALRRDDGAAEREEARSSPEPDNASSMSWPVVQVRVTNYMTARHPLGMDFGLGGAPTSPITAAAGGTVIFAGGDACCSYGYYVIVDHGNGLQTLYAHLSSIGVSKGQQVSRGESLGIAGNTGNSRGVHLHFEVYRDGKRVDPMLYLPGG